jgi:hypothetical protein
MRIIVHFLVPEPVISSVPISIRPARVRPQKRRDAIEPRNHTPAITQINLKPTAQT